MLRFEKPAAMHDYHHNLGSHPIPKKVIFNQTSKSKQSQTANSLPIHHPRKKPTGTKKSTVDSSKSKNNPSKTSTQPKPLPLDAAVITQTQLREILSAITLSPPDLFSNPQTDEFQQQQQSGRDLDPPNDVSQVTLNRVEDVSTEVISTAKLTYCSSIITNFESENNFSKNDCEECVSCSTNMSLLDQKRLQWAKEKAQMETEWNPWGRPGCGAPLMTGSGLRKQSVDWGESGDRSSAGTPRSTKVIGTTDSGRLLPPLPLAVHVPKTGAAPSFRNSLPFGAPAGSGSLFLNHRDEGRRKWSEELENQHEEQLIQRPSENESLHSSQVELDRMSLFSPHNTQQSTGGRSPIYGLPSFSPTLPMVSESRALSDNSHGGSSEISQQRSYLRGANITLDPEAKAELELKRRKQREQQMAIQAQLEEKQRRIREEKERLRREEWLDEQRLAQQEELYEQQKAMEKMKLEDQKKTAKAEARDMMQLKENQLESQSDGKRRKDIIDETDQLPLKGNQGSSANKTTANAETSPIPVAPAQTNNPAVSQFGITRTISPYIENRLLTPTKYRGSDSELTWPPRECGTQTDSSLAQRKDVGIVTSRMEDYKMSKKTKSDGRSMKTSKGTDESVGHRPKWGSNQADRSYQKQSEKEVTRHRLQEMRQRRLEEEAIIQCGQPHIGGNRTRSSAQHQRLLLASEAGTPVSLSPSHRSASPRLHHQSSVESTPEDSSTDISTRRQRRQWDSPRTDEIPNFYTQPLNLAGRRNSQSRSSQSTMGTPDPQSPTKGNRDLQTVERGSVHSRDRQHKIPQTVVTSWNSTSDLLSRTYQLSGLKNRMHSLENVRLLGNGDRNESWTKLSPNDRLRTDSRYSADDAEFVPYLRSSVVLGETHPVTSRSAPQWPQQNRILQQLSTIRQGLLMKQQEMDTYLKRDFPPPSSNPG